MKTDWRDALFRGLVLGLIFGGVGYSAYGIGVGLLCSLAVFISVICAMTVDYP